MPDRLSGERALAGADPAFDRAAIDVSHCSRTEIVVPLFEHEKAGHAFETWPEEVRRQMKKQLGEWRERWPDKEPLLFSCGVDAIKGNCVMIVHFQEKQK